MPTLQTVNQMPTPAKYSQCSASRPVADTSSPSGTKQIAAHITPNQAAGSFKRNRSKITNAASTLTQPTSRKKRDKPGASRAGDFSNGTCTGENQALTAAPNALTHMSDRCP